MHSFKYEEWVLVWVAYINFPKFETVMYAEQEL